MRGVKKKVKQIVIAFLCSLALLSMISPISEARLHPYIKVNAEESDNTFDITKKTIVGAIIGICIARNIAITNFAKNSTDIFDSIWKYFLYSNGLVYDDENKIFREDWSGEPVNTLDEIAKMFSYINGHFRITYEGYKLFKPVVQQLYNDYSKDKSVDTMYKFDYITASDNVTYANIITNKDLHYVEDPIAGVYPVVNVLGEDVRAVIVYNKRASGNLKYGVTYLVSKKPFTLKGYDEKNTSDSGSFDAEYENGYYVMNCGESSGSTGSMSFRSNYWDWLRVCYLYRSSNGNVYYYKYGKCFPVVVTDLSVLNNDNCIPYAIKNTFGDDVAKGGFGTAIDAIPVGSLADEPKDIGTDQEYDIDVSALPTIGVYKDKVINSIEDFTDAITQGIAHPVSIDIPDETDIPVAFPIDPSVPLVIPKAIPKDTPIATAIPTTEPVPTTIPTTEPTAIPVVPDIPDDTDTYKLPDLRKVFPFSVPFDLYDAITVLNDDPVAPKFTLHIMGNDLDFDFSFLDKYMPVIHALIILSLIVSLIFITRYFVGGE